MRTLDTHILAAEGYLELGLPEQALAELNGMMEEPAWHADPRTVELRAWIYRALGRWAEMEVACRQLCARAEVSVRWREMLALAWQHGQWNGGPCGMPVRAAAFQPDHPESYLILALHALDQGWLPEAAARLARLLQLCSSYREVAAVLPALADLLPIADSLAANLSPSPEK